MADDGADFAAELVTGPVGPDTLRLPGAPARLRQAVQGLHDLVATLDRTGQQLRQADARGDAPGKVVRALSHVAQRTGSVLDRDADTLRDLAGALDHEADVLRDAQSATLPELRSRWHAARADLADAVQADAREGGHAGGGPGGHGAAHGGGHPGGHGSGHGGGHGGGPVAAAEPVGARHRDAQQLAHHLDGQVVDDYEHLFRRWLGATVRDPGDGAAYADAVLEGGPLDEGVRRYKQTVRAIMEDYADAVRRVESADQHVAGKLSRHEHDVLVAQAAQGSAAPAPGVSSPDEVQRLAQQLQQAGSSLQDADRSLEDIRLEVRGGRMLPHGERVGSNDGFRREWGAHFEDLRDGLSKVQHHSDTVLRRLQQLEEEGAQEIRRAGRADG